MSGSEGGVAGVADLASRREHPEPPLRVRPRGGGDERGPGGAQLRGDALHRGLVEPVGVQDRDGGVARERSRGEDVRLDDREGAGHGPMRSRRRRAWRPRARVDHTVPSE